MWQQVDAPIVAPWPQSSAQELFACWITSYTRSQLRSHGHGKSRCLTAQRVEGGKGKEFEANESTDWIAG